MAVIQPVRHRKLRHLPVVDKICVTPTTEGDSSRVSEIRMASGMKNRPVVSDEIVCGRANHSRKLVVLEKIQWNTMRVNGNSVHRGDTASARCARLPPLAATAHHMLPLANNLQLFRFRKNIQVCQIIRYFWGRSSRPTSNLLKQCRQPRDKTIVPTGMYHRHTLGCTPPTCTLRGGPHTLVQL